MYLQKQILLNSLVHLYYTNDQLILFLLSLTLWRWVSSPTATVFKFCHSQNNNWIDFTNSYLTCVWNVYLTLPKTDHFFFNHLYTSNEFFIFYFRNGPDLLWQGGIHDWLFSSDKLLYVSRPCPSHQVPKYPSGLFYL